MERYGFVQLSHGARGSIIPKVPYQKISLTLAVVKIGAARDRICMTSVRRAGRLAGAHRRNRDPHRDEATRSGRRYSHPPVAGGSTDT
jgi:hypothetical protein